MGNKITKIINLVWNWIYQLIGNISQIIPDLKTTQEKDRNISRKLDI